MIYIGKSSNGLCIDVSAPIEYYLECKSVTGGRWLHKQQVWRYPATPYIGLLLHDLFVDTGYRKDGDFRALLDHAKSFHKIQRIKTTNRKLKTIPNTKMTPWPHQLRAYHYARKMGSCMLGIDMGGGKTKVIIDLMTNLDLYHVLVVCPKKVIDVWGPEVIKHSARRDVVVLPLKPPASVEKRTELADSLLHANTDVFPIRMVVINYEALWLEPFNSWALDQQWNLIVSDESHRVKGAGSNVSRYMYRLGQRADRRIALTGTMAPNSPLDIYGQYRFLDVGLFGSNYSKFRNRYAIMGGFENRQVLKYQRQAEMSKKLHRIAFIVDESIHEGLPPETDVTRTISMSAKTKKLYKKLNKNFIIEIDEGKVTAGNSLTKMLRLQELTSGFTKLDSITNDPQKRKLTEMNDEKLSLLDDILEDIAVNTPLVVFARFTRDLRKTKKILEDKGWNVGELSGKKDDLKDFQEKKVNALVVQIQAGKEGIDLTRARYGIFFSYVLSYGDYRQCRKRIRRPGQKNPHTFIHLTVEGSIDTEIMRAYGTKGNVIDYLINLRRKI